jgi:hypothetical protein
MQKLEINPMTGDQAPSLFDRQTLLLALGFLSGILTDDHWLGQFGTMWNKPFIEVVVDPPLHLWFHGRL